MVGLQMGILVTLHVTFLFGIVPVSPTLTDRLTGIVIRRQTDSQADTHTVCQCTYCNNNCTHKGSIVKILELCTPYERCNIFRLHIVNTLIYSSFCVNI